MSLTNQPFRPSSSDPPLCYLDTHAHAAAPPADVVVFVHAFPLGAGMWWPQLQAYPPGWRFVAPNLRGFDGTEEWVHRDGTVHIDDYADDVLSVMTGLGIARAVIVGLSMGGYVAFALHRKAPERVRGLLLADTRATADGADAREARIVMAARLSREGSGGWLADQMVPKLLAPHTRRYRPAVADDVRVMMERQTMAAVRGAILRMASRPDATRDLGRITVPVSIVVGAEDAMTPVADARAMHDRMAASALEIIPEAGHLSSLEQPGAFNAALSRLLSRA